MGIFTQDLGERRRLIEEGATLFAGHRCDGDCAEPRFYPRYHYQLLGRTFEVIFPDCWNTSYWTGAQHVEWLSEMFGVKVVHMKELERAWEWHKRGPTIGIWKLPTVMQRGPWRYYCLRDVIRSGVVGKRTHCIYCGGRCRGVDLDHWDLVCPSMKARKFRSLTLAREISEDEYEYWCSAKCKKAWLVRERHQLKRQDQRQRMELLWIRKGKQDLRRCREILRNQTRNSSSNPPRVW